MNNTVAPRELIRHYAETGDPNLAVEIQKTIRQMPPEQKLALAEEIDSQQISEPAAPVVETFEAGKAVVEKSPVINQVEIPETGVVVPPAVEAADQEILKEVETVVPEVAREDQAESKMEEEDPSAENPNVVDASAPIDFEQARARFLAGDSETAPADQASSLEEVWYGIAA